MLSITGEKYNSFFSSVFNDGKQVFSMWRVKAPLGKSQLMLVLLEKADISSLLLELYS